MICVSIADVSYELAAEYARKYPFVEFRLETLPISIEQAGKLFSTANRSIATCRPIPGQEDRRQLLLKTGLENGADFVDLEIDTKNELLEEIRDNANKTGTKLILSYHNFDQTPEETELRAVCERARKKNADIVKIACAVHRHEDNLRLISLWLSYPSALIIGMGTMGRLTRLLGPFLGSPFAFACPDDQPATAPGQLPYSRMKHLQSEFQEYFHEKS